MRSNKELLLSACEQVGSSLRSLAYSRVRQQNSEPLDSAALGRLTGSALDHLIFLSVRAFVALCAAD